MSVEALRRDVLAANRALTAHGLVHASFGKVSAVDRAAGVIVIEPSDVPYEDLKLKHGARAYYGQPRTAS